MDLEVEAPPWGLKKINRSCLLAFFEHPHLLKLFIVMFNFKKILFNGSDYDLCDGILGPVFLDHSNIMDPVDGLSAELQVHHQLLRMASSVSLGLLGLPS